MLLVAANGDTNWTSRHGYLAVGSDVEPPSPQPSIDAALAHCEALDKCEGITFKAHDPKPTGAIDKVYFKSKTPFTADALWQTWQKHYTPPPPTLNNPCRNASSVHAEEPWCDPTLPIDERVKDMLGRMSQTEKIGSLGTNGPAIPSLSLNPYNWWSEASHGVASGDHGARTTPTTNFAFPITTAMSWVPSIAPWPLWRETVRLGATIGA